MENNFNKNMNTRIAIASVVLSVLTGCGISDGAIEYRFTGRILADSMPNGRINVSFDVFSQVKDGAINSLRDPAMTATDSFGNYQYSISQGCSGSTGFFGLGEESNCDERFGVKNVFISLRCRNDFWAEDTIKNIDLSSNPIKLPDYFYAKICSDNSLLGYRVSD